QTAVPRLARARSFPLLERHKLVWIWLGDASAADPALLPDLGWRETPGWSSWSGGYLHLNARHTLLTENLLDASHVGYLHTSTIGGDDVAGHSHAKTEVTPFDFGV